MATTAACDRWTVQPRTRLHGLILGALGLLLLAPTLVDVTTPSGAHEPGLADIAPGLGRGLFPVAAAQSADNDTTADNGTIDLPDLGIPSGGSVVDWVLGLGATVALIVALAVVRFLSFRVQDGIRAMRLPDLSALQWGRMRLLSADWVRPILLRSAQLVSLFVVAIVIAVYALVLLRVFPETRPYQQAVLDFLVATLVEFWRGFVSYLPDLGYIVIVAVIVRVIVAGLRSLFDALREGRLVIRGFHRSWARTTFNLIRFTVWVFAAILIFPRLPGAGTSSFQGISLFVGAVLTLGASSAIANAVAGTVLTYTRAFESGDRVKIADNVGDITSRTLFVTRMRTLKNIEITIPNSLILAGHIANHSRLTHANGQILHITVTIGYDVPWRQVHDLLREAAIATDGIRGDPEPFVLQLALNDFAVTYELNAHMEDPKAQVQTKSDLLAAIQDRFREADVEILSPHYRAIRDGNPRTVPAGPIMASGSDEIEAVVENSRAEPEPEKPNAGSEAGPSSTAAASASDEAVADPRG